MIPLPKKCSTCQCRRCLLLGTCDIGDEERRSPCEDCGDEPYMTEGCRFGGEEPQTVNPQAVMDAFNGICTTLPKAEKITQRRRTSIRARNSTLEEFERVFRLVDASEFLRSWPGCSFDWILKSSNWQKIIEGNYSKSNIKTKPGIHPALDYPQTRYTEKDLAHIFVNLDGDLE